MNIYALFQVEFVLYLAYILIAFISPDEHREILMKCLYSFLLNLWLPSRDPPNNESSPKSNELKKLQSSSVFVLISPQREKAIFYHQCLSVQKVFLG